MRLGQKLVMQALEKEQKRLTLKAQKAAQLSEEFINATSTISEVRSKATEILRSGEYEKRISEFEELANQEKAALKLMKKDPMKVFDAEHSTRDELNDFNNELSFLTMRYNRGGL
ncbi:hypothetical protein [Pseudoalteromonas sp. ASV78]|uniref:hypothetical protein n=1 Tax=Pseudoalteromonas sp. ASV78 TaxID=3397851 RepID=UPI0039FD865E